jgi:hypothetical protein
LLCFLYSLVALAAESRRALILPVLSGKVLPYFIHTHRLIALYIFRLQTITVLHALFPWTLFSLFYILSLLHNLFPKLLDIPLVQDLFFYQVLDRLPNCRKLRQILFLPFNQLLLQVIFQVVYYYILRLLIQKVHVVLHSIHQLVLSVVRMQVKTLLVSALVLLQKVCTIFCCTEYRRNLSSLYLNPVQSLPHQKIYFNCECCITRFLICYVHLDECRAVFTLGAYNYFIDCAVFSKMQMVPQQLKSLDNYVWIIVF